MKGKQRNIAILILMILIITIIGCSVHAENLAEESFKENYSEDSVFDKGLQLSAWAAYWNLDIDDEIRALGNQLDSVSYFEAFFDEGYRIIIPDELNEYIIKHTIDDNYVKYLTIVNDIKKSNDKFSLKDVDLLKQIVFNSSESQNKYIDEIINVTLNGKFDGVEIDFEGIKNDIELWNKYIDFIDRLYSKCTENNLGLRIVLEPNIPIEKLEFIEGPVYVIMCYNLHYSATEPGEKANPDFINELMDKMEKIPGIKDFAVASGGFDWREDGQVTSIDEIKAEELINKHNIKKNRDSNSKCINFEYIDEQNEKHEVWYADKYTLNNWMELINDRGYKISLWKLGGNKF